jgi:hypothetical protein
MDLTVDNAVISSYKFKLLMAESLFLFLKGDSPHANQYNIIIGTP